MSDSESDNGGGQSSVTRPAQRSGCIGEITDELQIVFAKSPSIVECEQEKLSSRETCLLILVFLLISIGVTLAVVTAEMEAKQSDKGSSSESGSPSTKDPIITSLSQTQDLCMTKDCVMGASRILDGIDQSVDPCNDFYSYSCNGWLKENPTPPNQNIWSVMDKVANQIKTLIKTKLKQPSKFRKVGISAVEKVKLFYQRCVDMVASEQTVNLSDVIRDIGGWDLVKLDRSWQLTTAIVGAHRHWADVMFYINVGPDPSNRTVNIIQLYKAGLGIPPYDFYQDDETILTDYKKYIRKVGKLLGLDPQRCRQFEIDVFTTEKRLASMIFNSVSDNPVKKSILDLSNLCPMVSWRTYFRGAGFKPADYQEILVNNVDYFKQLNILLKYSQSALNSYLVWKLYLRYQNFLDLDLRDAAIQYTNLKSGKVDSKPRSDVCFSAAEDWFNMALSKLYVDEINFTHKHLVVDIVNSVKRYLVSSLDKLPWVSGGDILKKAKQKAELLNYKLAFPDLLTDEKKLNNYYKFMEFTSNYSMSEILLATMRGQIRQMVDTMQRDVEKSEWHMAPYETNAYYTAIMNEIVVPVGFLQKPYFSSSQPQYLNYASIGAILGHELAHGFDSTGIQYDAFGSDTWSQTEPIFNNKSIKTLACLEDAISNASYQQLKTVDGRMRDEIFSDIGGLKASYKAYIAKKLDEPLLPGVNKTNRQIFFIGYAQSWCESMTDKATQQGLQGDIHPPSKIRVNTAVSEINEFAEEFKCSPNAKMNPATRCDVW